MKRLLIALAIAASVGWLPIAALAQQAAPETCACYCTGDGGATIVATTKPAQCADECERRGEQQVMCAFGTQSPADNVLCFSKTECEGQKDTRDRQAARWTGQTPECIGGQGYCTPIQYADIDLSFKLGAVEKVADIGQYVQVAYNLLLGICVTVAIVMVMVGGVQYVLGAGMPEQVAKAKRRIQNAVIGLVLLLSAYLILYTVNPQLVSLELPAVPMAKRVTVFDESVTCERLVKPLSDGSASQATFGEETPGTNGGAAYCGTVKMVLTNERGEKMTDGSKCQVMTCPQAGDSCVGVGDKAKCVSCKDVTADNETGVEPGSNTCGALSKPHVTAVGAGGTKVMQTYNRCFYAVDTDLTSLTDTDIFDVTKGVCAEMAIDCVGKIKKCEDYDTVPVASGVDSGELDDILPDSTLSGQVDDLDIETVCSLDPCGIGRKTGKRCVFDDGPGPDLYYCESR